MKQVFTISRGLICAATLLLALSACAAVTENQAVPSAAGQANAAEQNRSAQRGELLLKSAEAFFRAGQNDQAKAALRSVSSNALDSQQITRRQNLTAAIALTENNSRAAIDALQNAVGADTPPELRAETHRLRAVAYAQAGNVVEAVRERIALAPLLTDADARRSNEDALWQLLVHLPQNALQNLSRVLPPDTLGGWVTLALISKTRHDGHVGEQIEDWRRRFPQHPASEELLASLSPSTETMQGAVMRDSRIALLLPLTGAFAKPAEAVRDGFFAAYFQDPQRGQKRITVYDTGDKNTDPAEVYARAAAEGADVVVGPLAKEAVAALKRIPLPVPTLALNYSDDDAQASPQLFQFGLSPEQEAREVAERAWLDGRTQALVVAPAGDWGSRVMRAFQERWEQLGGRVVGARTFEANETDLSTPLRQMLNIDASERRARALRAVLQTDLKFEPQRRRDADFVFMAAFPRQARQIPPQLKFFYAGDLPVYATSHIYEGAPDPAKDRDLDGVLFPDMPWVLGSENDPVRVAVDQAWPGQAGLQRLYALGVDAYRLVPYLHSARMANEELPGATGRLRIDNSNRVQRSLTWARFSKGEPALIAASPPPAP